MGQHVKRSAIGLALVAALTISACGSSGTKSAAPPPAPAPAANPTTTSAAPETIRLWLNGTDTKQEFVDFARPLLAGLVDKLTTSLSSTDTPDVVELGNTQAQAFEAAGALTDLTAKKDDLGGADLLQSLVEAGTYNGKFYAAPYYAGARIVVYRKDLFQKSGIRVPQTISDFIAAGIKLKKDNANLANFSGIYFPGKYWYAALPFIWMNGGDIATQQNGKWQGQLESAGSVKGLQVVKQIMDQANGGLLPAKKSLLSLVPSDEASKAQAAAAQNTRFTPSSEHWAAVEAGTVLQDMFVGIAQGGNIQSLTKKADDAINAQLNP
jgi:N,N'-diacetylchitobiose transport system substrate-binding protein